MQIRTILLFTMAIITACHEADDKAKKMTEPQVIRLVKNMSYNTNIDGKVCFYYIDSFGVYYLSQRNYVIL